ncbi:MAG: TetR/AcrR family transcriptional regulator [Syntrophales bacterium]|nr:TetR/AcrR family transcriptional regulator [Syntrophales bacterium]
MEGKKLPRRQEEKIVHREQILAVALDLFSHKGYYSVSMHEIARNADFAIGTLYNFFKNKEDLYKAMIVEQCERFHDLLDKAIDISGDEVERIGSYIRVKGEIFMNNTAMIRLYFAETRGASFNIKAGLDADIRKMYEGFLHKLAGVFESGIKKKRFMRLLDPYYLAVAIDSLTNAFLFLWLEEPERHPYYKNVETITNIFFNSVKAV